MTSALSVKGLEKRYGKVEAVRGVDLEVHPGELVALIGHNGAGKTTTLRMITGQLTPSAGTVHVAGVDCRANPGEARRLVGYVPEEPALYDYLTAREMLELVVALRGAGDVEAALEFTALGQDADRLIREYSQGMRRRTALAAAVVARPPLLVLDESLNGLDPPSAARVKAALRALCAEGTAVLYSTHVLETVERLADRVVMMAHGTVVADRARADLGDQGLEALFLGMLNPP